MLVGSAGDDKSATMPKVGYFMGTEHVINGFLAYPEAVRDFGNRDSPMLAIHGATSAAARERRAAKL
jgi:hypothetical protein